MRRSFLLVFFLLAHLALGAEIKIPDTKVKAGRLAKIEVQGETKTAVKWVNVHADLDLIPDSSGRYAIVLGAAPGQYKICVYTSDEKGPSEPAYATVTVEGRPVPPPDPPVPPGPTPDPTPPKAEKVYIVCVMDETRTPAQAAAVGDSAFWGRMEAAGHRFRVWPYSSPSVARAKLDAPAKKAGLPALILLAPDGAVLKSAPLPATTEGIENLVKEVSK